MSSQSETDGDRLLPIDRALDILEQTAPSSALGENLAKMLDARLAPQGLGFPAPTPKGPARLLTIGMATYDDYDGVYFSVQAIRMFHPEITAATEILVLDNNPGGPCSAALKQLETYVAGYRYVPYGSAQGTAARDWLFREANSPYVLSMDSHVLFAPGSLAKLVEFLKAHPDSNDLWHGPMLGDELMHLSAKFKPVWSEGMYGVWEQDARAADPDGPPFEIDMQGLGVFACRKEAWPGFNPRFNGFGGEEGYIHEKIRRSGGAVFCLPFLRWVHRFDRPSGAPYRPNWKDRIRNYAIACDELGLDRAPMIDHFEQFLGSAQARPLVEAAWREIDGPFHFFDAVYAIGRERRPERWSAMNLDAKVRFFRTIETPLLPEIGRALAHRAVLDEANRQGLKNVLVIEDGFADLPPELEALAREDWLGLRLPHMAAYNRPIFDRVLRDLPETPSGVALWLRKQGSLDEYFARVFTGLRLLRWRGSRMVHGFGITAFGWRVAILADCERTRAVLDRYLFPWLPRCAAPLAEEGAIFQVLPAEEGFEVRDGGRTVAHAATLETLVPLLQGLLDEGIVHRLTGMVAVHAGAVAFGGSAILLPGPSHAGKSTLVAELVRRGCVYFSDEYALIDDLGLAHPYPRAMMLRNGLVEARPFLASEWNVEVGRGPAPVRLILALEHAADSAWNIRRVPQSEMLLMLLKNTPHSVTGPRDLVTPFLRASGSAACFTGIRSEAASAAGRILELAADTA